MNAIGDIAPQVLAGLLFLAALAAGILRRLDSRPDPSSRERLRRLAVNARGRTTEAVVTEAHDNVLYYSYAVRGVEYAASQDVSGLRDFLSGDTGPLVGPATLKYSPENPADSILVCEEWSGLQRSRVLSS
jgi:hypothetical protein